LRRLSAHAARLGVRHARPPRHPPVGPAAAPPRPHPRGVTGRGAGRDHLAELRRAEAPRATGGAGEALSPAVDGLFDALWAWAVYARHFQPLGRAAGGLRPSRPPCTCGTPPAAPRAATRRRGSARGWCASRTRATACTRRARPRPAPPRAARARRRGTLPGAEHVVRGVRGTEAGSCGERRRAAPRCLQPEA